MAIFIFTIVKFLWYETWLIVLNTSNLPHTDQVVSITGKQSLTIG